MKVKIIATGNQGALGELIKNANISEDYMEVHSGNGIVIITSATLKCTVCGSKYESNLIKKNGVHVCVDCSREMADFADRTEKEEEESPVDGLLKKGVWMIDK